MSRLSLSLAAPWDVMDLGEYGSTSLDADGFLLEFPAHSNDEPSDVTLGLSDVSESDHQEELPCFFSERVSSPVADETFPDQHRVSPDSAKSSRAKKNPSQCIKRKYNHSFRKLVKSMRESDATRSMIKRQKRLLKDDDDDNFFASPRCSELEDSRRKLFKMLSNCI